MSRIVGGFTPRPVIDQDIIEAALFAVNEINRRTNSIAKFELVNKGGIVSAESQVVDGTRYRLRLKLKKVDSIYPVVQTVIVFKSLKGVFALESHSK